jgi:hypothetical protein
VRKLYKDLQTQKYIRNRLYKKYTGVDKMSIDDDIDPINEEEDDKILLRGDSSRYASAMRSWNPLEEDHKNRGKSFEDLGYVAELTNRIAFDGISREHGMHIEAHPTDREGHRYEATVEQVQPNEGRRLRAQGIEQRF